MTMAVHDDDDKPEAEFERPKISRKHYIAVGASGWVETFERAKLDPKLETFVAELGGVLPDLLELFRLARLQERRTIENWHTVRGFLARTLNTSPRMLPPEVVIAFWARYVLWKAEHASQGAN